MNGPLPAPALAWQRPAGAAPALAERNNNPGNIRYVGQSGAVQGEGGFAAFPDLATGVQAMSHQLGRYWDGATTGQPLRTVRDIISTWAPPNENDTGAYVRTIANAVGVDPDAPLSREAATSPQLIAAMARHEAGYGLSGFEGADTLIGGGQGDRLEQPRPQELQFSRQEIVREALRRGLISGEEALNKGLFSRDEIEQEALRRGLVTREELDARARDRGTSADTRAADGANGFVGAVNDAWARIDRAVGGPVDSITQGAALGYGPRLTALEKAGWSWLGAALTGNENERGFWENYNRFLDAEQAQQARFRENNPVTDTALELGGAVVGAFTPGAPAAVAGRIAQGGRTLVGQTARAGASGAVAGGVYGSSEGEGLTERSANALTGAGLGAAGGVVGYGVARQLGRVLTRLVGSPQYFQNGKLTDAGRQALEARGIDPAQVSDEFVAAFAERVQQASGATDETARLAQADEFGIPLTRGQATGDAGTIAFEEAARNVARGDAAKRAVDQIDDAARVRVGEAQETIATGLGGRSASALEAGERVGEAVKAQAAVLKDAADSAYDVLAGSQASAARPIADQLLGAVRSRVDSRALFIDETTPAARAMTKIMERRLGGDGRITFQQIEQTRQDLNRLQAAAQRSGGPDQIVMGEIKATFDDWLDGLFSNALMDGDPAVLTKAKEARGLWREFKQKFFPQGKTDDAGKLLQKIVEIDATPKEVADMLFGASAVGERGVSARLAARLKRALPAEAFDEIRSGAFLRAVEAPAGKKWGYQQIANRLEAFVSGPGSALARQLYSADELAQMQRYARALKLLVPPAEATNPSRTGYAVARLGGDVVRGLMGTLGLAAGGPAAGIGAMVAQAIPGAARNAFRAAGIPATKPLRVQIPARLAAGVPVGSAVAATEALGGGR